MTIFLNGLMVLMSVLFFAGRLYEVSVLMYTDSGFLSSDGIVTSPLMLTILFFMALCCGILMFSPKTEKRKPIKFPVGVFGFAAALFLIASAVMNIINIFKHGGFLGYDIMVILSALGLSAFSIMGIKGKKRETIPFLFTMLLPLAICMDCIILNIKSIQNTEFLIRCLCGIIGLVFFTLLFKCAYAPKKFTLMGLYVFSLMNFLIGTAANLAGIIGSVMNGSSQMADIMFKMGLAILGTYALFIAFYIVPSKEKATGPVQREDEDDRIMAAPYMRTDISSEKEYRTAGKISEETIARIFAQKDAQRHNDTSYNRPAKEKTVKAVQEKPRRPRQSSTSVYKSNSAAKDSGKKIVYKAPK